MPKPNHAATTLSSRFRIVTALIAQRVYLSTFSLFFLNLQNAYPAPAVTTADVPMVTSTNSTISPVSAPSRDVLKCQSSSSVDMELQERIAHMTAESRKVNRKRNVSQTTIFHFFTFTYSSSFFPFPGLM